ncbi:MAG: gliding motility-associated C-terminal domain-containing protein, partial [Saprospiraceae bacterium]
VFPDSLTCLVNSITLRSNGSSTGQNYQYLWSTLNGNILDPLTLNNIKVNKKGTYTFEVKDTINKCSASQTIEVFEDVNIPNINISLPTVLTCKIRSIILQLNILNNINSKIQWTSTNGNIVSGGTSLSPVVNKEGLYYVKVINANGCSTVDSVLIAEIKNVPTSLEVDLNQPMCEGDDAILQNLNITGGVGPFTYELDGSSVKNFPINNLSVGIHQLKAIDKNGCEVISNFTIDKPSQIQISLPPDAQIDEGASYVLNLKTSIPQDSIESIKWEPSINLSCDDCLNPTILNLKEDTVYTVTVINKNGCIATATIRIKIIKRGIWTPNVFSPNSDGINDYFYPYAVSNSYKNIKLLKIYDRWGALIFSKENFQANLEREGWDGNFNSQPVNPGVFIYYLIIEWNSGETSQLQGEFTLIR